MKPNEAYSKFLYDFFSLYEDAFPKLEIRIKQIYKRSTLRNTFLKDSSDSNWQKYRMQRNKCVKIRKKMYNGRF